MAANEYRIFRAGKADVKCISAIEKACMPMPWSYTSLYDDVVNKATAAYFIVRGTDGRPAGFGGMHLVVTRRI